jgi:hypothetical protein
MLSPLPRVYEEGHNGQAVPSEPEPSMIGGDVQVERLTSAAQETKKRLEIEVLQPIKQWMVAYRTIQVGGSVGLHALPCTAAPGIARPYSVCGCEGCVILRVEPPTVSPTGAHEAPGGAAAGARLAPPHRV